MIGFERFLIEKGYTKFCYDVKTRTYYEPTMHIISTMSNLCHFYIHESDIEKKNVICVGLHEVGKPITLIEPRPIINIKRKRIIDGTEFEIVENEVFDDSMNIILEKISYEDIYKAMFDKSINFYFDLT